MEFDNKATFPTELHRQTVELVKEFFLPALNVDTFLVVNSCDDKNYIGVTGREFTKFRKQKNTITAKQENT